MKMEIKFPLTATSDGTTWECFDMDGMFLFETNEVDGKLMTYLLKKANENPPEILEIDKEDSYEV